MPDNKLEKEWRQDQPVGGGGCTNGMALSKRSGWLRSATSAPARLDRSIFTRFAELIIEHRKP
jgi:hypothetical protein